VEIAPKHAVALYTLAVISAKQGHYDEAIRFCSDATKAVECAAKQGNQDLAVEIGMRLDLYRQNKAFHQCFPPSA